MTINEEKIIEQVDEQRALACLLADDVCILGDVSYSFAGRTSCTTGIFVLANDVFAWGCADAEDICSNDGELPSQIIELYSLYKEKADWGVIEWLCVKRNMQPQPAIKNKMVLDGVWNDTLELLPSNPNTFPGN